MSLSRGMERQSWLLCTVEYYSALRRGEILIHAATQMSLEDVMLSDIRDRYCLIPLT